MATQTVADSRADHAREQKLVALCAGRVWSASSRRRQCSRVLHCANSDDAESAPEAGAFVGALAQNLASAAGSASSGC